MMFNYLLVCVPPDTSYLCFMYSNLVQMLPMPAPSTHSLIITYMKSHKSSLTTPHLLKNWAIPGLFLLYFCIFNKVDSTYKFCQ